MSLFCSLQKFQFTKSGFFPQELGTNMLLLQSNEMQKHCGEKIEGSKKKKKTKNRKTKLKPSASLVKFWPILFLYINNHILQIID